ncbi:hypothetical protein TRVA0_003S01090 [Trichomonascus vanleenenianus]|uniref:Sec7 domain-containing protein n=1 Tax=Trichomonascus vanleenenianus TaxID=2268995 RepID=UPI003ECADF48
MFSSVAHDGEPPKKRNGLFRRLFTASHSSLRKSSVQSPPKVNNAPLSSSTPRKPPVPPPKDIAPKEEEASKMTFPPGLLEPEKRDGRAYSFASTETAASYISAAEAPLKISVQTSPQPYQTATSAVTETQPDRDQSNPREHESTSNADASSTTSTTVAGENPASVIPGAFPSSEPQQPNTPEIVVDEEHILDCHQASTIAEQLFQGQAPFVTHDQTASWLGDSGNDRARVREAYMELFDFTDKNVLTSLRRLCDRLYLKAESQQIDRLLDAFADRWCQCNPHHGFKSPGIVYTLAYSILLLNTDHHSEEFQGQKRMPRSQYVHQTLETMRNLRKAEEEEKEEKESIASGGTANTKRWSVMGPKTPDHYNALVSDTTKYTNRDWETVIGNVLKQVYNSVDMIPLNLAREKAASSTNRLYPQASLTSMANSSRASLNGDNNSLLNRFSTVNRRSWLNHDTWSDYEYQGAIASNNVRQVTKRRSMYASSTSSGNGAATGLTVENIGFAGALRNTMIREEQQGYQSRSKSTEELGSSSPDSNADGSQKTDATAATSINDSHSLLTSSTSPEEAPVSADDDYIALQGAPWAKEGLLRFQAYLDTGNVTRKHKKRDWVQVFVVVHKGYLKMFRFDDEATPLNHRRSRTRLNSQYINSQTYTRPSHESLRSPGFETVTVGAGNWMENATMTDNISLCHTMAQVNPVQKEGDHQGARRASMMISSYNYHSQGGIVDTPEDSTQWSLTLPSQGVLIFLAGTRDIAEEYVYTCNYWASRISKEPLLEAVSSVEYGWSRPLELLSECEKLGTLPIVSQAGPFDTLLVSRERIQIKEWKPPVSSTVHCSLEEGERLEAMKKYVETVRRNFETHSEHRVNMMKMLKPSYLMTTRAHSNWERKSQYLLKETVKYDMYISTLERAIGDRHSYEARRHPQESPESSSSEQSSDNETLPTDEENEKCDNESSANE